MITNDRYIKLTKPTGDPLLVFLVQTDALTGDILQCPAKWDEQANAYRIVSVGAGHIASQYPADGGLVKHLRQCNIDFELVVR